MKILKQITAMLMFAMTIGTAHAQTANDTVVKDWERAKAFTKEYLDVMPDASYALKPTPQMRSFAEQLLHLSDANYTFAAAATDQKSPFGMGALEKVSINQKLQ